MVKIFYDNKTGYFDIGRLLWAASVISSILFEGISIIAKNQNFDPISFGSGVAALLAGGGFSTAIKDRTLTNGGNTNVTES